MNDVTTYSMLNTIQVQLFTIMQLIILSEKHKMGLIPDEAYNDMLSKQHDLISKASELI